MFISLLLILANYLSQHSFKNFKLNEGDIKFWEIAWTHFCTLLIGAGAQARRDRVLGHQVSDFRGRQLELRVAGPHLLEEVGQEVGQLGLRVSGGKLLDRHRQRGHIADDLEGGVRKTIVALPLQAVKAVKKLIHLENVYQRIDFVFLNSKLL
jgi:hypothetical protein